MSADATSTNEEEPLAAASAKGVEVRETTHPPRCRGPHAELEALVDALADMAADLWLEGRLNSTAKNIKEDAR